MRTIEELLEDDIQRFLDEKAGFPIDKKKAVREEEQGVFSLDKDFVKETEQALKKNDLEKAKKVFEELKNIYSQLKYSDIEKAKIFRVLDRVHIKIKDYLISRQKEKDIYQEISDFEKSSAQPQSRGSDQLASLRKLYSETETLIENSEMAAARQKAKELIRGYNNLLSHERTQKVYGKIKELLLKLK